MTHIDRRMQQHKEPKTFCYNYSPTAEPKHSTDTLYHLDTLNRNSVKTSYY